MLQLNISVGWLIVSDYNTSLAGSVINGVSDYLYAGQLVAEVRRGAGQCVRQRQHRWGEWWWCTSVLHDAAGWQQQRCTL